MLSKHTNGNNGHKPLPADLLEFVPAALREKISESFEREGIMNEPAEQRILRAIADNHKELQASISSLKDTLHAQDKRLTLEENKTTELKCTVEEIADDIAELKHSSGDVSVLMKAAETAANDRRDTKRLAKGAAIGAGMTLVVTAVMGYYGLRGTPTNATIKQEAETVQQESVNANDLKELIKEIRQDREERKAEPTNTTNPQRGNRYTPAKPKRTSQAPADAMRALERGLAFAAYKDVESLERRF